MGVLRVNDQRWNYFFIGVYVGVLGYMAWRAYERRLELIHERQCELAMDLYTLKHPPAEPPEAPQ